MINYKISPFKRAGGVAASILVVVSVLMAGASGVRAATKIYLQIKSTSSVVIAGGSTDPGRSGWFDVANFSHGLSQQVSGGVRKVSVGDLFVTKFADKGSVDVFYELCRGRTLPEATLEWVTTDPTPKTIYQVKLTGVRITYATYAGSAATTSGILSDMVSLEVTGRIDWTYYLYDSSGNAQGTVTNWYDIVNNTTG